MAEEKSGSKQPTAAEVKKSQPSEDDLAKAAGENAAIPADASNIDEPKPATYEHLPATLGKRQK